MSGCHVMAKPASSRCNLACRYCFYLERPRQPLMDDATLETFVRQHIAAQSQEVIEFAWQGGEPTLAGLRFFHRVQAFQQRYAKGKRIQNTLQTNGVLLDDEWCDFLQQHGWLVGISLDGPAIVHDHYRVTRSGKPTHYRVIETIERLKARHIEFNLLVVVNAYNCQQPEALYDYLKRLGTPFIQFIPLVEWDEHNQLRIDSVTGEAWGAFLCRVFERWMREDIGKVFVQIFDSLLGVWSGYPAQMCVFSETCGHAFALEANGDIYQCDHYVYPEYLVGNLHQVTLSEMNSFKTVQIFAEYKRNSLPLACQRCSVLRLCYGDCPKHRPMGKESVLCSGYQRFFSKSAPYMKIMRDLLRQQRSPAELTRMLNLGNVTN